MDNLQWQVSAIDNNDKQLWQDWQTLFESSHAHNPMLDTRFVQSLFSHFPASVYNATGTLNGKVAAILLLEKSKLGRWKNYLPSQSQLALMLALPNIDFNIHGLMASLGGNTIKLDIFGLDPQEHSSIINSINQPQTYAKNIKLQINGLFDDYWRERPKRLRKDISKNLNRLAKDEVEVVYKQVSDVDEIKLAVDRYGLLESQGWKGKNGTAIHPANIQGQFYLSLLEIFAQNQQAQVFESYIDKQLAASRLCIFNDDTLIILKTTFDEKYSRYALGNLNRFKLIENLFEKKTSKCVDFYTNASKEQLYWSTEQRPMFNASCYRFDLIEQGISLIKHAKHKLKNR